MKLPFPATGPSLTATVTILGGIGNDGSPAVLGTVTVECYFEEGVKTVRTPEGEVTKSLSKAIIKGDITNLSQKDKGNFCINGRTFKIDEVRRFFDLDNSVHHLELMVV